MPKFKLWHTHTYTQLFEVLLLFWATFLMGKNIKDTSRISGIWTQDVLLPLHILWQLCHNKTINHAAKLCSKLSIKKWSYFFHTLSLPIKCLQCKQRVPKQKDFLWLLLFCYDEQLTTKDLLHQEITQLEFNNLSALFGNWNGTD